MCPSDSSSPIICPAGSYNNRTGQSACNDCPPGFYCELSTNTTEMHICPAGMYCQSGSATPTMCSAGTYNKLIGQASCSVCPAGSFCLTGSLQGTPCKTGHYCPEGSVEPIACPTGTYQTQTGRTSVSDCNECPCGFYCYLTGLSSPTGNCDSGNLVC